MASDDPGLIAVLASLGLEHAEPLGHGGEAWVYAIDDERIVRVLHAGGRVDHIRTRQVLVDELARSKPAFALPEVIEIGELEGRVFAIERRLRGRSVIEALSDAEGPRRTRLIEAHLDAAAALGDLHLDPRAGFGELINADGIITSRWHEWLEQRAAANLARALPEFHAIDATALASALPDTPTASFVHLDAFTGNMLTDGTRITAVVDISGTAVAGDRRLDPVTAAIYLASPDITPVVMPADVQIAMGWLRNAGLDDLFEATRRWLAAYWSFAHDDPNVLAFCRATLIRR